MDEVSSNRSNQTKFRLNEINKIKDYTNSENQEMKVMSKNLSKYIAAFNYFDKNFIVLYATSGEVSITSSVIGALVGIASSIFALVLSSTIGIIKSLLKITKNKKEET